MRRARLRELRCRPCGGCVAAAWRLHRRGVHLALTAGNADSVMLAGLQIGAMSKKKARQRGTKPSGDSPKAKVRRNTARLAARRAPGCETQPSVVCRCFDAPARAPHVSGCTTRRVLRLHGCVHLARRRRRLPGARAHPVLQRHGARAYRRHRAAAPPRLRHAVCGARGTLRASRAAAATIRAARAPQASADEGARGCDAALGRAMLTSALFATHAQPQNAEEQDMEKAKRCSMQARPFVQHKRPDLLFSFALSCPSRVALFGAGASKPAGCGVRPGGRAACERGSGDAHPAPRAVRHCARAR